MMEETAGPEPKKLKLEENGETKKKDEKKDEKNEKKKENETQEVLTSFSGFKLTKILSENSDRKNVVVEGTFEEGRRSIVVLERLPIRAEILSNILNVSLNLKNFFYNKVFFSLFKSC